MAAPFKIRHAYPTWGVNCRIYSLASYVNKYVKTRNVHQIVFKFPVAKSLEKCAVGEL